jgi:hypothetical protein
MSSPYTIDPNTLTSSWRTTGGRSNSRKTELTGNCESEIALLVGDIHDWAYVVLDPQQVNYKNGLYFNEKTIRAAVVSVAAKAAAAKLLYRLLAIIDQPVQCGLNRKRLHMLIIETVDGAKKGLRHLATELADTFFQLYITSSWDVHLSPQSLNMRGKAEAIKWPLRNSSETHLWGPGEYTADEGAHMEEAMQYLKKAILSDSVAPPAIGSVDIASRMHIPQMVVDNPKYAERIIQIGSRSTKHVGSYLSGELLHLLDKNLMNAVTPSVINSLLHMYIDGHDEADLNKMWSAFFSRLARDTNKNQKAVPDFIKVCVMAMKSKPEVFRVDGGRLLNRLFEMSKFSANNRWHKSPFSLDAEEGEPWGAYAKAHPPSWQYSSYGRSMGGFGYTHGDENIYISTFLRQIPMLLNRGNSRTLCEHFKAMESIPAEVRSRILGAMMHSPKSYGINAKESKLLSILAHDLTNGDAHAEYTDRGCEIVTGDGMRVLLTNSTESGGER